ncbi:hypothetical protein [Dactylosporangium sp. CA-233914]|uniref:hypothetical protein n=1 Tax=Dactylosporangium sp. CA-233914 TaxID=3239934 RepID=UPI003D8FCD02
MTIAVSLKVNDGVVLAADSASTLAGIDANGQVVVFNVYKSANKIFNLYKGLPIGVVTWGTGAFGNASIERLVKDFRQELKAKLDPEKYALEDVASEFRRFMYEDNFLPAFGGSTSKGDELRTGFILAGYSSGGQMAEEYQIDMTPKECDKPQLVRPVDDSGIAWNGQPEAITRLLKGFGSGLGPTLAKLGMAPDEVQPAVAALQEHLQAPLVQPGMPFQDAIDLATFLVDTTVNFVRFSPGADTVGGPVDVAGITKHEGFKWIKRKHYYRRDLNPD